MGYLDTWTIYEHPADFPEHWVVRPFRVESGRELRAGREQLAESLEEARSLIPIARLGLMRMERSPDDDPVIVESWI